ncbi:diguanylate cyclase [Ningiella sp. W23]|uniref:diguanylate cyclase n=1 Tax=Ningiella sp. W23 TaxID=3023715 RepID=UPI003757519B
MHDLTTADTIWLLFCSSLLLLMQAGFTCLESGLIRSKNSANVVMKNLIDLTLAFLVYGFIGFGLMYYSVNGYIGSFHPVFGAHDNNLIVFFIFQAMFCATAITIVSGAVAERMTFIGYALLAVFVSAVIYPIVGQWVWGGAISFYESPLNIAAQPMEAEKSTVLGWLAKLGFYDYAGATVVHSVGGWVALATLLIIGPRLGRYDKNVKPFEQSSLTMVAVGSFFIWIGWIGFNGGSLFRFDASVPKILLNTLLGGAAGMCSALVYTYYTHRKALVIPMVNGGLIGLISVTGATNHILPYEAILLGALAGPLIMPMNKMLNYCKIDDAVGAIPVHLAGGVFATIAAGFFIPISEDTNRFEAILIQCFGVICVGIFTFSTSYIGLVCINRFYPLRVSAEDEQLGLNMTEHNSASTGFDIVSQLNERLEGGDYFRKVQVNAESDTFEMAKHYNKMVDKLQTLNLQKEEALQWAVYHANHDSLTGLFNRYALNRQLEMLDAGQIVNPPCTLVALVDIDHFKKINDAYGHDIGDKALVFVANHLSQTLAKDMFLARAGGEEFCIILRSTSINESRELLDKLREHIAQQALIIDDLNISMTVSVGAACFNHDVNASQCMKRADMALYAAKESGRNQTVMFDDTLKPPQ